MQYYKYIVFDFFGTLVDYNSSIIDAPCRETAKFLQGHDRHIDENGFARLWDECFTELEAEAEKTLREYPMDTVARLFFKKLGGKPPSCEMVTDLIDIYMKEWMNGVKPFDGLADFLDTIGSRKAIITNTHYAPAVPNIVARFHLGRHFDVIETSVENGFRKPDSRIFLDTLDKLGCKAGEALYVGDSIECDYHGPEKIGMDSVLITKKKVRDIPKDRQIPNILELKNCLQSQI